MTLCIESVFTIYGCANKNVFSKTSNTFLYSFFFGLVKLIQYISLTLGFPIGSTDEEWLNMEGGGGLVLKLIKIPFLHIFFY